VAVLIAGDPGRIDRQRTWLRIVTGTVIAFITLANLLAAVRLVVDILTNSKLFANNAGGLLAAGGVIWATNVIAFRLWYWDLDRESPAAEPGEHEQFRGQGDSDPARPCRLVLIRRPNSPTAPHTDWERTSSQRT
jgi:hypothetical protein